MTEAIYRRELDRSYMMIRNEALNLAQSYGYRMMMRNRIRKLLPCQERCVDGESWLYYDISSRQPLGRLYEGRKMGAADIGQLLEAIAAVQADMGEYLLDGQGLLLEPDFLFADVETEELYFCFYPGAEEAQNRYAPLADFLLEHVDHGQEPAVNLAYQFYKLSKSEYFVLSSFLPYLEKETNRAGGAEAPEEWNRQRAWEEPAGTADDLYPGTEAACGTDEEPGRAERADRPKGPKGWLRRLADRLRGRRKAEWGDQENAAGMGDSLWDAYYDRLDLSDAGETVYFADLEKPAGRPSGRPCLMNLDSGQRIFLETLPVTVGKLAQKAGIVLEDPSVSRVHARLFEEGEGIWLMDLNSRNGTVINGRKLAPNEAAALSAGDEIGFGRERFRFGFIDSKEL